MIFCPEPHQIEVKRADNWLHSIWLGIWMAAYAFTMVLIVATIVGVIANLIGLVLHLGKSLFMTFKFMLAGLSGNLIARNISMEDFMQEQHNAAFAQMIKGLKQAMDEQDTK